MIALRTFVALVCLCSTAAAREIYVNNVGGDDRWHGWSESVAVGADGPVQTIAKALRLSEAGDRVVLTNTGEPYRESVVLFGSRHSGSPVSPFILEGNGATIDGSVAIPAERWQNVGGELFSFSPRRLGYQQLFAAGEVLGRQPMSRGQLNVPQLGPREWCFSGSQIYFRVEPGKLPADYDLSCCLLRTGITLSFVERVVIRDLVVQGFSQDGIRAIDLVRGARIDQVTCRANGRSGIAANGASRISIEDCVLEDNGESGLRSEDFAHVTILDGNQFGPTSNDVERLGGEVKVDIAEPPVPRP